MIIAYTPAFLTGVGSFVLLPVGDFRFDLLRSAITAHFFKRMFEVLFVHKFSGWTDTEAAITISLSYFINSVMMIYSHYLIQGFPEPERDLKYFGVLLFLVGISGNFYHHYLLSQLRTKGDKNYKIPQVEDFRFNLFRSTITIHFFKRIFEVLFVHKYSAWMDIEAAIALPLSYLICSTIMTYSHYLIQGFPEPQTDLKYFGALLFLVGISGNFYHHYLLSKLRIKGDKNYKIPQGGLFSLVICPHYLFEIMGFFGMSCISQTLYPFCFALGSAFYLMGRSYATRKWYQSKFEDFPTHVKALIPYIF
ncbi:3-oxo-5-alpha-steroid 4-dehydrogenase family protein [Forsythia ovata]|uniref:3-oxo-5-alpha-steroid 4-dehydrogenase family protein n=1 Tax=Forsythia ovata TaxID=205694 RepID=A0ABD1X7H1_9LAMI